MSCHQCGHIAFWHTPDAGCFWDGCDCPQYVELNARDYGTLPLTRAEIEQWCVLTERLLAVSSDVGLKTPMIRGAMSSLVAGFRKQMSSRQTPDAKPKRRTR